MRANHLVVAMAASVLHRFVAASPSSSSFTPLSGTIASSASSTLAATLAISSAVARGHD
jgi:hypothetical protein